VRNFQKLTLACVASGAVFFGRLSAQDSAPRDTVASVRLLKLDNPEYPAVARAARIAGDVVVVVAIEKNGSVKSVAVIGGPQLLRVAAVESAEHSQFECANCTADSNSIRITYTFQISEPRGCTDPAKDSQQQATVDVGEQNVAASSHVTLSVPSISTCDPVATVERSRSVKCLFLWHCARKYDL
jgi:TonB family protein